jgi:hypothetical protein
MKCTFAILVFMLLNLVIANPQSVAAIPDSKAPETINYCDLSQDPAPYNRRLIRLKGTVSQGFEDFSFHDSKCGASNSKFSLWLMYGGNLRSGTVYCCPGEGGQEKRKENLKVEGIETSLVLDPQFYRFRASLKRKPHRIEATVVGWFFSGEKQTVGDKSFWAGYGHLGCCSLFVIQRVERIDDK